MNSSWLRGPGGLRLLDLNLPDSKGLETLQRLRRKDNRTLIGQSLLRQLKETKPKSGM
jgi:DNA-binding response OmpR family regulator